MDYHHFDSFEWNQPRFDTLFIYRRKHDNNISQSWAQSPDEGNMTRNESNAEAEHMIPSSPQSSDDHGMVYTQSKLDDAHSDLREIREYCASKDIETPHLENHLTSYYNLRDNRTRPGNQKLVPLVFPEDNSDNGDEEYVDAKPTKGKKARSKSKNKSSRGISSDHKGGAQHGNGQLPKGNNPGILTFKFNSEQANLKLQGLANGDFDHAQSRGTAPAPTGKHPRLIGSSATKKIQNGRYTGPSDIVERVRTCFDQPVWVDHEPTEAEPCFLCVDHRNGMLGNRQGWRETTVLHQPDKLYWEEMTDGDQIVQDPKLQTLVCKGCTVTAMKIRSCPHDQFARISRKASDNQDFEFSDEDLLYLFQQSMEEKHQVVPECKVCLSVGEFACAGEHKMTGRHYRKLEGLCGLVLCKECHNIYKELRLYEGTKLDMIAMIAESENRTIRADFELLKKDNYMSCYWSRR